MSKLSTKKSYSNIMQSGLSPWKIALLAFLSLVLIFLLVIYFFLRYYTPTISSIEHDEDIWEILGWNVEDFMKDSEGLPVDLTTPQSVEENPWRKGCYTFLIVGKDDEAWRTDTMMYVMLDTVESKISIAQLPRDTYVNNAQGSRLNSIVSSGRDAAIRNGRARDEAVIFGLRALMETARMTFGVPINYYVFLDLAGFIALVDLVGDVEVYVPFHMKYDDPEQNLYIDLPPGLTLLDGKKAEQFIRFRGANDKYIEMGYQTYVRADIDRLNAQKDFLTALMKKMTAVNFSQVQGILRIADQHITTNIGMLEMVAFARDALQIKPEDIRMITMPGEWNSNINRYTLYRQETINIINNYFNPYENDIADDRFNVREFSRREIGYADLEGRTMAD